MKPLIHPEEKTFYAGGLCYILAQGKKSGGQIKHFKESAGKLEIVFLVLATDGGMWKKGLHFDYSIVLNMADLTIHRDNGSILILEGTLAAYVITPDPEKIIGRNAKKSMLFEPPDDFSI